MRQTSAHALALAVVEDWQLSLRKEFEAVVGESDSACGALLAKYAAEGKTQREIAAAIGKEQTYVGDLLRYHRFYRSTAMAVLMPERRWREYWKKVRDPYATRGGRTKEVMDAYEAKVFPIIVKMIAGEKPPIPAKILEETGKQRNQKREEVKTVPSKKRHNVALRQEIQHIYGRIKQDVQELEALSGAEPARLSTEWIANHAKRLREGFMQLQKALKREISDLVV